jgi:hypothetical protein
MGGNQVNLGAGSRDGRVERAAALSGVASNFGAETIDEVVAPAPNRWVLLKLEIVNKAQRAIGSFNDLGVRCEDEGDELTLFWNFRAVVAASALAGSTGDGFQQVARFTYDAACKTIIYQRQGMPTQLLRLIATRNAIGFVRGREGLSLENFLSEFSEYLQSLRSATLHDHVA